MSGRGFEPSQSEAWATGMLLAWLEELPKPDRAAAPSDKNNSRQQTSFFPFVNRVVMI